MNGDFLIILPITTKNISKRGIINKKVGTNIPIGLISTFVLNILMIAKENPRK
tara:strand:- start:2249 stop:2407 length:159 start_codon:yes stop_codon:yes gene_type:complete